MFLELAILFIQMHINIAHFIHERLKLLTFLNLMVQLFGPAPYSRSTLDSLQ
uniref:Uncharacterized protein n=1 Tax=Nelumbo nucifera TaxID=4432 RepID=A0A822Z6N7_NELNU|nr:TPA_asm: hypothetical protein HUJ06_014613 [Nelumbo nucifera]